MRDAALQAVGEPVLRAVPGYTISTAMGSTSIVDDDKDEAAAAIGARLFVTPPRGETVVNATSSDTAVLTIAQPADCTSCRCARRCLRLVELLVIDDVKTLTMSTFCGIAAATTPRRVS